jgi:hypothetical protein
VRHSRKTLHKKRAGGVAQGVDPEFKPQWSKKKKKCDFKQGFTQQLKGCHQEPGIFLPFLSVFGWVNLCLGSVSTDLHSCFGTTVPISPSVAGLGYSWFTAVFQAFLHFPKCPHFSYSDPNIILCWTQRIQRPGPLT